MGAGQAVVLDDLPQRGCGENPPPADRTISRAALAGSTRPVSENLTPVARLPSNTMRWTIALVTSRRFGRFNADRR
jgi:hypothetical protein